MICCSARNRAGVCPQYHHIAAQMLPHLGSDTGYSTSAEETTMQTITAGYQGVSLLVNLNWDRLIYLGTIVGALGLGAWVGSLE